ncbi:hypothetical protein HAX54_012414 [Datura stramonium]|uniref:TF-B3 domain-containing protein n=1 Tax=Datura stramonium TaxID=4076 RepID=A0ABS8TJS2_DATST|nr:hypothetical protein [Datura stramonium]
MLNFSYAMEDGAIVMIDQFPDDLSPFSQGTAIDTDPISYFLPPQSSSSSTTADFSSMSATIDDNATSPFLSLFTLVSENPSNPTFSLFPQVSENVATFKPIGNNNPPPPPTVAEPSTDLCLSLPFTPDTSSTITTLHCSIGSQDSSALASSNCVAKRSLFQGPISISKSAEEKFVPVGMRKELTNNAKRQRLVIQPAAVPSTDLCLSLPSTDICLSLPSTPDTSSTITALQCSIGSQDSSALASSDCAAKRSLFQESNMGPISISKSEEEKFVPLRVRKEWTNNAKQHLIIQPVAVPSTALCLSLPFTPGTSSTITTPQCSTGSQDFSAMASSSCWVDVSDNCAAKRSLFEGPISISKSGEEKFVPVKKFTVRKESVNDAKRQRVIIQPVAAAAAREEGHWITKKLTKSDVNGASRLLLPRQEVKNYILPFLDEEKQAIICQDIRGIDVTVLDLDTETEHNLTLKKWSTDSFQLVKAWTTEFVKRRNLKQDDVISIRWEKNNSRFCFRVQMRNQVDGHSVQIFSLAEEKVEVISSLAINRNR